MAAQFSENSFYYNGGFSDYNGLLLTLSKNISNGLQFDFNYTYSHSIDNISFFANSQGDTGIGSGVGLDLRCHQAARMPGPLRLRHEATLFDRRNLPVTLRQGKNVPGNGILNWANDLIGYWDLSGVASFHSGEPWATTSNAFVASYSNDAPAIFTGSDPSVIKTHVTKLRGRRRKSFQRRQQRHRTSQDRSASRWGREIR